MKHMSRITALGLSIAATSAFAADGYVTGDVNLRAGPDSSYPSVAMLGAGTSVAIQGCVDGWSWCDVAAGENRGWVAGNFLQEEYEGRRVLVPSYGVQIGIPIVAFAFGTYWDDHYRNRSWYGERDRWSHVTPHYHSVDVHGGPHGNAYGHGDAYSHSHENPHNVTHVDSHSSYANHDHSGNEVRETQSISHQSAPRAPSQVGVASRSAPHHANAPAVAAEPTARPAAHTASAPRTSVARTTSATKPSPASETHHPRTAPEHVAPASAHKEAPKAAPNKEGDNNKDQH